LKADSYYNMGNALFRQERWREALDAYKHALGLRPDDRRAKWNLELALRRLQKEPPKPPEKSPSQEPPKPAPQQQSEAQPKPEPQPKERPDEEKRAPKAEREPPREIDRQDAESTLDALERTEPHLQKDLARRRAQDRRPAKDW